MKRIYDRGKLRVAMLAQDRKPFFYTNEQGSLAGGDVDLATDLAAKFGVGIEFIRTAPTFDEVVNQVAAGQADIAVSKLSATLDRAKKVMFTSPYLTLHQGLLVNRLKLARLGQDNPNLLATIKQNPLSIGVVSGTSYVSFGKELFPRATIVSYPAAQDMLDAALKGDLAAIFYDELQLKDIVGNNPTHSIELQLMIMLDQIDPIAIAVSAGQPQLLNWINLYLDTNRAKVVDLIKQYGIQADK
jgi:ABC-type amino acid transport substrate-binding protein